MNARETVEKSDRNVRRSMRALVIPVPVTKAEDRDGQSKALPEDPWDGLSGHIIEPPFDPLVLSMLQEQCTELEPSLQAMETNIDGFGHRFVPRVNMENGSDGQKADVKKEKIDLINFFEYASLDDDFTELRTKRRRDYESTGNAYWEVVRNASGKVQGFTHLPSYQMRIGTLIDQVPIKVNVPILELQVDGSVKVVEVKAWRKFRSYVQSKEGMVRWFKEFGDKRVMNNETGEIIPPEQVSNWQGKNEPMPEWLRANEAVHWCQYTGRSVYGIPRYIGALFAILGDRQAEEVNFTTFTNNNVPSMFIAVSNGQLTPESIKRLKEYVEAKQQGQNFSRMIILEAEGAYEGEDTGQVKVDITPLSSEQIRDALFQEYSQNNQDRIRRMFRLPPIMVGKSDDYTRATADTSRRLADEQIFAPERERFDSWINRKLFPAMGIVYHKYRSNTPNTTDNTQLVSLLARAEKTGGMTPRIARTMLEDILGIELGGFKDEFDPDMPFSLTMAEAVKNKADVNEPGQQVTALKQIEMLTGGEAILDDDQLIAKLFELKGKMEGEWLEEVTAED